MASLDSVSGACALQWANALRLDALQRISVRGDVRGAGLSYMQSVPQTIAV